MGILDGLYNQLALGYVQIVLKSHASQLLPYFQSFSNMLLQEQQCGLMNKVHTTTQHLLPMLAIMMLSTIQQSQFHPVGTPRISNAIVIGLKECESAMSTSWQGTLMSLYICVQRRDGYFSFHVFSFKHLYTQITNFILPDFIPTLHFTSLHML